MQYELGVRQQGGFRPSMTRLSVNYRQGFTIFIRLLKYLVGDTPNTFFVTCSYYTQTRRLQSQLPNPLTS